MEVIAAATATGQAKDEYAEMPEQLRIRRQKLDRLREEGIDPYPVGFTRTATTAQVRAAHPDLSPDTRTGETVAIAGRVLLIRTSGRLCFATVQDGTGRIQVMLEADRIGDESLSRWLHDIDLGDHVGVRGEVITSRRG